MFRLNKTEEINLFDPIQSLSDYSVKKLNNSWAGYFRENIFPKINEEPFSVLYSDVASRPNTPVNIMISLLIIKEMTDLNDEELMESMMFDLRFQYALHTTSMIKQPISKNMLTNFRNSLLKHEIETEEDLLKIEIERLSKEISKCVKSDKTLKRMDSMMINSSCKKLSRINLIYKVNVNVIEKINEIEEGILKEEFKNYLDPNFKKEQVYSTTKETHQEVLKKLLEDSKKIYESYKGNEKIKNTEEFKLLERLINEQMDDSKNEPRESKQISPKSLQNPSDPDATYRFKYKSNVGYVANIEEEIKDGAVFITGYDVQQNVYSDQQFMQDYIEKKDNQEEETMLTDAAYYSEELADKAAKKNITIIPTQTMGIKKKDTIINKFEVDENKNEITKCPSGETPVETKYNEKNHKLYAKFDKKKCEGCPMHEMCQKEKIIKKNVSSVTFTKESYNKAKMEEKMNNEEYKKISNKRAGIEGTPSTLRRKYNVDNLPVRGKLRVKLAFGTKIMAMNIKKAYKYAKNEEKKLDIMTIPDFFHQLKIYYQSFAK